ncbi:hypothetical protein MXB_4538 [Myxobolus squamalis]|nr:hypothetical protein MXB_4538 [Myxobolus squamalis]
MRLLSLSEIQESQEFKNISMFKAWWDILLDYLVAATALNVLLLLARMASVDTGGLICVNPLLNKSFGYVESRYVNSRCCSESEAWILIFHPYLMLFMWMCITACHICWIKIPSINTKMEAFYAILYKIFTTQPKFYRSPTSLRMTAELSYNEANQKAIDVLLNKLLYLMTEKPFLRYSYIGKHSVVMFLCFISVSYAIFVISFPFIYVLVNVDCVIRIIMICLSIKGIVWATVGHLAPKQVKNRYSSSSANTLNPKSVPASSQRPATPGIDEENPFGEAADYLSGMPSYPDLLFCIRLLKRNVHDGHLMYEAICTSIKNYVKKLKSMGAKYKKKTETERVSHQPGKFHVYEKVEDYQPKSYHEYIVYVRWMSNELGLEEVPNSLDSNNLFESLLFIKNSLGLVDLSIESNMRKIIVKHIRSHPELYKTLIDEDRDFDTFEVYSEKLSKSNTFGSHYAIQAAATLLNVKIVIIHCEYIIKLPEIFVPLHHNLLFTGNLRSCVTAERMKTSHANIPTKFLTYVAPHFYHATVDMPVSPDWPHIVSRRMNYSIDRKYRWDLRQSAIRSVILQRDTQGHISDDQA